MNVDGVETGILALHRYFLWADCMRLHFEEVLRNEGRPFTSMSKSFIEANLYMSYWYAGMYVVVEGWNELGLNDDGIAKYLESANLGLLKRYRNGVFHFQKKYFDKRFDELIQDGKDVVEWIRGLREEFSRFFLEWFKTRRENEAE